jgi:hypothetical protein
MFCLVISLITKHYILKEYVAIYNVFIIIEIIIEYI